MSLIECIKNGTAPEDLLGLTVDGHRNAGTIESLLDYGFGDSRSVYEQDGEVTLQIVYSEGGGEGEGQHVERVIKATCAAGTAYWRVTASYDSWSGTEWNSEVDVVFPKEVTATQYFTQDELSRR